MLAVGAWNIKHSNSMQDTAAKRENGVNPSKKTGRRISVTQIDNALDVEFAEY